MKRKGALEVLSSVLLLCISAACIVPRAAIQSVEAATADLTLAESLNSIINNVDWTYRNSWTANWATILARDLPSKLAFRALLFRQDLLDKT